MSWFWKIFGKSGITILSKFFVSRAEIFVGNPSMIHKNLAMHRFYAPKRSSTIFGGKFLVSQFRKLRGETLLSFRKVLVLKSLWIGRGCHFFRRRFFVPSRRKTPSANASVFQKLSGIKLFWINGVSRFCRLFLSHSAKNCVENPPIIQKI